MQTIFTKVNQHVFNMIWHMDILKIQQEEQLLIKAFNIAKNLKYDGYQRELSAMVYKFFDKKSAGSRVNMCASNEKLAEELH